MPSSLHTQQPVSLGITAPAGFLPAAGFVLVALAAYAVNVWVFKKNSLGGLAWFMPFLAAGVVGVWQYRRLCHEVGVLSNRESLELGRSMGFSVSLAAVLVLGVLQRSVGDGVVSTLLGLPIFLLLLAGGMFVVKTQLLMRDLPERGADSHLDASDLEAFAAEYRRARGIKQVRDPAAPPVPKARPSADVHAQLRSVQNNLPQPKQPAAAPRVAAPAPSIEDEAEIRRKILEVRAAALKAQRKAEKAARS